ncbi:S4 domain-containing protein YaaA [Aerococcus christensenii]|uniref:S4 domain-containing protein YaaA n=1 Tax=Aerococcus christensenii TaxID=87541 RepID=A0A133XYX0_9LACT|nr:S4 domain-containing protein YaaA [Aerococcus christensenii]KXB36124.1 hypothetical protein HMPREF3187_01041 [Aerococcus christensenii]MDK8233688.1 S4 domain-containing protein YaaA [Aerococcus christensenii]PKY91884.1 S4 domain-containing protein YaaA [Aerococcus christensenii]WEB71018.1 S4 domain-containing protein YaaA [Aerococcus christensenii]
MLDVIAIDTPYITLGQLLKALEYIQTGGQAKTYLMQYQVELNGQPENRRGKKIYPGDKIHFLAEDRAFEIQGASENKLDDGNVS